MLYEGKPLYKNTFSFQQSEDVNPYGKTERDRKNRPYTSKERRRKKEEARRRHAERRAKEIRKEEKKFEAFKKSWKYHALNFYSLFCLFVALILILDLLLPSKTQYLPIENVYEEITQRENGTNHYSYYLEVCSQTIELEYYVFHHLQNDKNIKIAYSSLLSEVNKYYVNFDGREKMFRTSNLYPLVLILLLPLLNFLSEGPHYGYYRIIEMTLGLSLVSLFITLLTDDRLLRIIGVYGC